MISPHGLSLIMRFEGLRTTAYPDPGTGGEPWTIGYGHTNGVQPRETCSEAEALAWLQEDCAAVEEAIAPLVEPELTQSQLDAIISFVFNVGIGNFRNSTMLRLLNSNNLPAAAQQFRRWANANGHPMAGLLARREAEAALFLEA